MKENATKDDKILGAMERVGKERLAPNKDCANEGRKWHVFNKQKELFPDCGNYF